MLQAFAMLALVTIVRDQRPDPLVDAAGWQAMGMFVEFMSIAPLAVLLVVVAAAGLHALDPELSAGARSRECAVILKLFAWAVLLIDAELVWFGIWKGVWEMFGAIALVASCDLVLVFLVFRAFDLDVASSSINETARLERFK